MSAHRLLRYARHRAGLSQRELTQRSGVPQPTIARIEAGRVSPRIETLEALLASCGQRLTLTRRRGEGVDRTAIHELLRLTPDQRLRQAAIEARNLDALEAGVRR
jgi:predicted transcriptional regulator